ncbi:tRNA pseudouridine(38-40) synthase TruA [Sporolactobacillus shoreicorticis]|uniref:tRNA pseudouridine synthase A n=1 Tax=Sporolactobacillus shoreicorticis TaxID=1923877 RepID=A0ABW5S9T0_9BACL|nr:tRNA pseudouridine(38-40) synthase TruA [Sporolactobacillus shoreicorticis]MCO7127418.1 tRNA pseudouridine(38-40) synthase TruA [Sporolactobacillus shoreicorticis]
MTKIKCTVAYDGTLFHGYQVQPGKRTVQREIEAVLSRMHHGQLVKIAASGRTDAGVHAFGQVFHFETPLHIPEDRWTLALNSLLPNDIYVRQAEEVSEQFHARYDVKKKEYRYRLLTRPEPDLFRRAYTTHIKQPLDVDAMNLAAAAILGTHDFSCFCAANTDIKDKVRTIYYLSVRQEKDDETVIRIVGSGFLYQMVRIITGTLLDVGIYKITPDRVAEIIDGRDRQAASATAPPQGLTLWGVTY